MNRYQLGQIEDSHDIRQAGAGRLTWTLLEAIRKEQHTCTSGRSHLTCQDAVEI